MARRREPREWYRDYVKYGNVGISIVLTTGLYLFLGYKLGAWLDEKSGMSPVFLVTFVTLATILSVVSLILRIMVLVKDNGGKRTGDGDD